MGESTLSVVSVPSPVARNPYQGLLYAALQQHDVHLLPVAPSRFASVARTTPGSRVLHVHWLFLKSGALQRRVRALRFRRLLRAARHSGWRIVWTAHNLTPHEASPLDEDLTGQLAAHADGIICHGEWARDELERRLAPQCPVRVIPHGHYRTYYGPSLPRADARAALGLGSSRPLIVCMGEVRPYKGVDVLLERLRNSDLDVDLIVAGRPMDSAIEEALRATAGDDDRIHLDLRYIPDDDVAALMSAADWAVLPYRRITTSGSLLLALGFGIPVIAPAHPAIMEVAATKALETFADDDDLIPAIRRAIRRDRAVAANAAIESTATLDWSEIGAATARFFREITAAPAPTPAAQSPPSSAS